MSQRPTPERLVDSLAGARAHLAFHSLLSMGQAALPAIRTGMKHPNWRIRRWSVSFLDHYGGPEFVPDLREALDDPIATVRRHAVHSIGCQRCKDTPLKLDVIGLLSHSALNDPSPRVRRAALHQLGCQPPSLRARTTLRSAIAHENDEGIHRLVRWALSKHAFAG